MHFGVIGGDRIGNGLQHHGLTRFRRGDNQATLALADWRNQIYYPGGQVSRIIFQSEAILRVQRSQLRKLWPIACGFKITTVDSLDAHEWIEFLAPLTLRGCRTKPVIASPLRRPCLRTSESET